MKYRMTVTLDFETDDDSLEAGLAALASLQKDIPDSFIASYIINDYKSDVEIVSLEEVCD